MSKQRQAARAEREAAAALRTEAGKQDRARAAAERARRERRHQTWRRLRLWQHGPGFRRHRETWGALATVILVVLLMVWLFTRSPAAVLGTALVCLVSAPVLVMLFFDRSRR